MSTDRRVYGLTGTANTAGSTVKRVSADGSEITYTWNASSSAYVATDGAGAYDKLVWTSSNSTWTWTDGGSQAAETYDYTATTGRYLISKATDTNGNAVTFSYLTGGKLNRVTTADGGYTQYSWSGNNITQITTGYTDLATSTAKTLTRTRYGYDASNRLTSVTVDMAPGDNSVTDGKTYVTTYGYDGTSKRVASITQTDGSSLAITYDASGRVKAMAQTAASGVTRTTTIDYQTGYTSVADPAGQITRMDYDAKGQLTKITAPAATTGAAQQVTQFGYTANGDLTSVIDPVGSTTSYTNFTAFGDAQTITDRSGAIVTRTFALLVLLLTPFIIWSAIKRRDQQMTALVLMVLGAVVTNAAVCGILSGPVDRYQSRILWLLPLLGFIAIAQRLTSTSYPTQSQDRASARGVTLAENRTPSAS